MAGPLVPCAVRCGSVRPPALSWPTDQDNTVISRPHPLSSCSHSTQCKADLNGITLNPSAALFLLAVIDVYNIFVCVPPSTDISALSYQTVIVKAGHSINLTCPGVSELSLISALEWRCQGCNLPSTAAANNGSSSAKSSSSGANNNGETSAVKLVEYSNNAVVVWNNQERMSLDSQTYALQFFPVRHYDHGEYTCLVNERRRPDTIIHLVVQGNNKNKPIFAICPWTVGSIKTDVTRVDGADILSPFVLLPSVGSAPIVRCHVNGKQQPPHNNSTTIFPFRNKLLPLFGFHVLSS